MHKRTLLLGLLKTDFRQSLTPIIIIVSIGTEKILVLTGIRLWHRALPSDFDSFIDHRRNEILKFFLFIFAILEHRSTDLLFLSLFVFVNPVTLSKLSFDCFELLSDGWFFHSFGFVGQFDSVLVWVKILGSWFSFELETVVDDQNTVLFDHVLVLSFLIILDILHLNSQVIFICWKFLFWFCRDQTKRIIFLILRVNLKIVGWFYILYLVLIFWIDFTSWIGFLCFVLVRSFRFTCYHPLAFVRYRDSFSI